MQANAAANGLIADKDARLRRRLLPTLLLSALAPSAHAAALVSPATPASPTAVDPVNFDASFFPSGMAPKVDLSRFEKGNVVLPGTYRSDIRLNNTWQARTDLVFANVPGKDSAEPCYDSAMLIRIGVDLKKVLAQKENPSLKKMPEGTFCGPIGDYIPGATADFDMGTQELSLSVPQIYINQVARGYVDPSQWDAGINAGVLNYTSNLYSYSNKGQRQATGYVGLNASAKLGSWHLYTLGALSWAQRGATHYQNTATYLQHDIPSLRAQLEAGDTFTAGDIFDSVRIRGMRLYTDDRMLPQSMRGYAPIVRGIAETNAHVIIRQRGYVIYDANVAPGAFAIEDLYPTGYGGDLDVEVTEADGRVQRFAVPYSSVQQLLRPGQNRWSVTAGKVEQQNLLDTPYVVQGTFQRGINNAVTGYTGATFANGYGAALVGAAVNTSVGAFSADITHATHHAPNQARTNGTSARIGYNKNVTDTGTNFSVAAYRYSTKGYVSLQDAVLLRDAAARGYASNLLQQRSRLDMNINQSLGDTYGQLFLQGSVVDYWAGSGRQVNFSAGYSNHWKSFNYSFSAQRELISDSQGFVPGSSVPADQIPGLPGNFNVAQTTGRRDTRFLFTVSVPLGRSDRAPQLSATINRAKQGGNSSQATVTGSLGADNRFTYGATAGQTGGGGNGSLNAQYRSPLTQLAAGYSQGSGYQQFNAGASGSLVVHGGGLTFGPPSGDTIGIVDAPNAAGATVANSQGAKVNGSGYAIVPNLMPYQLNSVALDPKGADAGLEMKSTTANVAPRAGSVVKLKYETTHGHAVMVETTLPDGQPVPFGAEVLDAEGHSIGVAGQGSRLFVRDLPASGTLTVKWGEGVAESCRIDVQLPAAAKGRQVTLQTVHAACRMAGATEPASATSGTSSESDSPLPHNVQPDPFN
ncbi:fimbria/pilus outer membrane usher protein [Dyella sp.]|uniref:fimbria/pilus outer membrane usher protein n=1 Tax=Dyella sp. TaxID=1869338 RepID=UPI002FDB2960